MNHFGILMAISETWFQLRKRIIRRLSQKHENSEKGENMRFTRILRKSLMPNLVRQIEFGGPITIASYMQRKVVFIICSHNKQCQIHKYHYSTTKKCSDKPNIWILYDQRSLGPVRGYGIVRFCYITRNTSNIWRVIGRMAVTRMDHSRITRTNWIFRTWTRTWDTCKGHYFSSCWFEKQGSSKFDFLTEFSLKWPLLLR